MAPESTTKCLTRSTLLECCVVVVAADAALAAAVGEEEGEEGEKELGLSGMLWSAEAILSTVSARRTGSGFEPAKTRRRRRRRRRRPPQKEGRKEGRGFRPVLPQV